MRAVVVALGKIGLPLAAQFALAGHEVVGYDIDAATSPWINAAQPPLRRRAGPRRGARRARRRRAPAGHDRHHRRGRRGGRRSSSRCRPLVIDADAQPDWRRAGRRRRRHRRRPAARDDGGRRDDGARRHHAQPRRAALARRSGLAPRTSSSRLQPRARVDRPRLPRPRDLPEDRRRHQRGRRAPAASSSTPRCSTPRCGRWARAETAELRKLAETTYRDVNIALANEFARFADRIGVDIDRVIAAANSQPYSHIHAPGRRRRRPLHPGLPALLPGRRRRTRACRWRRARSTRRCPPTPSTCSRPSWAA